MDKFQIPEMVYSGEDSLSVLNNVEAKKVMIVTDKFMVEFGYTKPVEEIFTAKGAQVCYFDGVKPDPSTEVIGAGIKVFEAARPDVVVAIGGGSVIDAAKAILYFESQVVEASNNVWTKPTFVAIPTTSGTGSECTIFSIVTTEKGKICVVEDWLLPDIAILDANFTIGVPDKITWDTGLDVLTHAIEAYVSTKATDFTDALAEKAVRTVFEYLPRLKANLKDKNAREKMHLASCMAGMSFSHAGLGLNHSFAHALGGLYHVPHGRANTVLMEAIMDFNVGCGQLNEANPAAARYAELAKAVGLPARTVREGFTSLRAAVSNLKDTLGVPKNIKDLGIEEAAFNKDIEGLVNNVLNDRCTPTNPRPITAEQVIEVYKAAYSRKY